jgi:uncharacterized protein YhhL (DUF1145 family)
MSVGSLVWVPALTLVLILGIGLPQGRADTVVVPPELQKQYQTLAGEVNPLNLQKTVDTLAGYGSRVAGYPGDAKAAAYVEQQFQQIGLTGIRTESFPVTVPIDKGDASITLISSQLPGQKSAIHSIKADNVHMYPLWPNLVRTSQLPENGLTAPLIYVGDGRLDNFNGKNVEGSVVMVNFNSRAEWLNAPRLGARAVIFIEPDNTMRGEAEAKFISIPISIPRFWLKKSDAAPFLAAAALGHATCNIKCDMPWEVRQCKNVFAKIDGTDPELKKQIIVIEGYYDSMSVVPSLAPGGESACGIASLLELARIYKANPPKRTIWFLATSAHHIALGGVREFLNSHIDEWTTPSLVEKAESTNFSFATALWLGGILLLVLLWFLSRVLGKKPEGSKKRLNAGSWVLLVMLVIMAGLNLGFYIARTDKPLRRPPTIYLWAGLDLTSQSRGVGIFYKGWFVDMREDIQSRFSDIARVCRENAAKIGQTLGFDSTRFFADGVNPIDGKNWRNFIPGKPAFDSELVTMAQGNGVTFATVDDARALIDTPFDTANKVNIANLAFQTRMLACEFYDILTDPNQPGDDKAQRMPITDPPNWSRMALQGGFATVKGRVTMFDPKRSFMAYPAPQLAGSLVVIKNRTKSYMGVRANMIEEINPPDSSGARNGFEFHGVPPLTASGGNTQISVAAYHLDDRDYIPERDFTTHQPVLKDGKPVMIPNPSLGEINYAPDLGVTGAKFMPLDVSVTTAEKVVTVVEFRCVPTAIYDLVDQQSLRALTTITVLDGTTNGEPRMYGYAMQPQDPSLTGSYVEDMAVIFSQPGTRLKIMMGSGPGSNSFLLINPVYDPSHPFASTNIAEGKGYLVGGDPREAQDADMITAQAPENYDAKQEIARGGAIYDTALHVAKDMWALDDFRIKRLAKYRIINEGINTLHGLAAASIAKAEQAQNDKDWERFDSESRAAWGFESRAYPDVQATAVDVVEGVLFYLALLIPFAYFMERLLIGSYDLKRQLGWASLFFLIIFFIFSQVHPAFDITMNPIIVLLAFIMLALSTIVMALIGGKFEEEIKQMNRQVSGVHRADIGRVSVALAAFNLGISNMRRRKARTILTCITLVLLTFTVLSFTSVVQTMRFNEVPSQGVPRYNGIMIRTAMWDQLQDPAYNQLDDEYGRRYHVAPRAWFFGTQLGEQSFLTLKRADRQYDAKAMVGMSPQEAYVTNPRTALLAGRWFQRGDTYVTILPSAIAASLRIDPQDVGKASVTYAGVDYTVIGILDDQKLKKIKDLDNEPITPVDFILMQKMSSQSSGSSASSGFREYTHLEPDSVFFVPYQTATDMGAELRSIAIDFGDAQAVAQKLGPLMHRLGLNLYAGRIPTDGSRPTIERYSSIAATSSRGMELVFFPVLIAALIVLNTMLGSVFERVKEIHIFSSIGLAPSHIAMLFIAEALVYAILGSVAGYLLGQLATKILVLTGAFQGLYLNFSSVSAVMTTLVVVGVVLLSTMYPARKAAEVATPALDRTWHVPDPNGDDWTIPLPFAVTGDQASGLTTFLSEWLASYEEYSIGDFVTQDVSTEDFDIKSSVLLEGVDVSTIKEEIPETLKGYRIHTMTWLAPFDLGVSQKVTVECNPTSMLDVYDIRVKIHRESGDISNWKRVNRRFLNTLRKQFLIWRTLKQGERERYLQQDSGSIQAHPVG